MKKTFLPLLLSLLAVSLHAKVELPAMIGDNMVLQQNSNAHIWGKAAPGAKVAVTPSWDGKAYAAQADAQGRWMTSIATPAASYEAYSVEISDGEPVTLSNVLVGEVWLASGQSNMQMPLKGFGGCPTLGGFDEIAASRQWADKIRFINIPLTQSYEPLEDTQAQWDVPSPDTAPEFSATAWYYAQRLNNVLDVPIGIVNAPYGGAKVESWLPREILETYPDVSLDPVEMEKMVHYYRPMLMYNAMFVPIKDYTYRGIIWYQGCSNVQNYETYAERLATMVEHWRKEIGQGDIPFYAVEIAPFGYDAPNEVGRSPYMREQQWKSIELIPNSDMIGTNDLVEPYELHNIHPGNKAPVGKRLGDLALNRTYGKKQFMATPPKYESHRTVGNEIWMKVNNPDGGLCRNYDIVGFEVAGPDNVFHPADNVWVHWQTNEIVISSEVVPNPVEVRYCFGDFAPGTMYGGNYLPLVPFRSDK